MRKRRLDVLMVDRGLSRSRENAQAMILAGDVRVDRQVVTRPAATFPTGVEIDVVQPLPYVSRGGYKLAHALDQYRVSVDGLTVLDVGASTGGFTDVLLQRGARRVYAIDVGRGQLAWKLRQDARVVSLERTNIRYVTSLPEPIAGAVVDVSFISLTQVLPPIARLLGSEGWIIALVKPQFEAGRDQVGKGGVVRDPAIHREVLNRVTQSALELDFSLRGCTPSPILGPAGNREFLLWLDRTEASVSPETAIADCVAATVG